MKPATTSLALSFLLFAFMIIKLPLALSSDEEAVKDVDGNFIYPGSTFCIDL